MVQLQVNTLDRAKQELANRGISWHSIRGCRPSIDVAPVHLYFIKGSTDVAYFTPLMETLIIHQKPRKWDSKILRRYLVIDSN